MEYITSIEKLREVIASIIEIEAKCFPEEVRYWAEYREDYIDGLPFGIVTKNWYFICEYEYQEIYIVDFAKDPQYKLTIKDMIAIKSCLKAFIKDVDAKYISASMRESTSLKFKRIFDKMFNLVESYVDYTAGDEQYVFCKWEIV